MLDVPIRVWLLIALAAVAFAPLRYVVRHVAHDPRRREITLPPEDLSWRSAGQLVRSVAVLALVAALAGFIFTPAATSFAQSRYFEPAMVALLGLVAAGTVVFGFRNARVQPFLLGDSRSFERAAQPRRFWASLSWNAAVAAVCIAAVILGSRTRWENHECLHLANSAETAKTRVSACTELLERTEGDDRRALVFALRGMGYDWLGDEPNALWDYSQSLRLAPHDANVLYDRARIYQRLGDLPSARAGYDAALELRPDNAEWLVERGVILLDVGDFDKAIADLTRAHELDPASPWPLANRGLAHAWTDDRASARSDFDEVRAIDPDNFVMLHGEAVLALQAGELPSAIRHLTAALHQDPNDQWALRMRADLHWRLGQRDKAAADDDRLNQLLDGAQRPRRSRA